MKKGDHISGPCIVRRRHRGRWEYAFLLSNNSYMPFGNTAPSCVKWCYQLTWKDELQKVHVLTSEENSWPQPHTVTPHERNCWWIKNPGGRHPQLDKAFADHAAEPPKML